MFFVYILKSERKVWYYVGSTNDLDRRINEHNNGKVKSTKPFLPFKMVYKKEFLNEHDARLYERKLKDCRVEKEGIIRSLQI
jgi:putative endonuclease